MFIRVYMHICIDMYIYTNTHMYMYVYIFIFVCQKIYRTEADLTVALEKWTKKGLQVHIQLSQPQFHSTIHPCTHSHTHAYTHTHSYTHKYRRKRLPPPPPSSHVTHVYTTQVNTHIHSHTCE